jgi:hypothetical protein
MKIDKTLMLVSAFAASVWTSCQSGQKERPQTDSVKMGEMMLPVRSEEDVRKRQAEFYKQFWKNHPNTPVGTDHHPDLHP